MGPAAGVAEKGSELLEVRGGNGLSDALGLALVRATSYLHLEQWSKAEAVCTAALELGAEGEEQSRA